MVRKVKIRSFEVGLKFRDNEFVGLLNEGTHWLINPWLNLRVEVVSTRDPWFQHEYLDLILKSDALAGKVEAIDLKDHERALVWIDGRFARILRPGLYAYWTGSKDVRVERIDARDPQFEHAELSVIRRSSTVALALDLRNVESNHAGVLFVNGQLARTLPPGNYAFWKDVANVDLVSVDLRETVVDITGQEIMTADKVTLRVNALVTYRVTDPVKLINRSDDARQTLYREAQLVLRAVVGARDLDAFLNDKDAVTSEVHKMLQARTDELGMEVASVGIRDVILPGDMKELMNRVTEAKKAAEANLITRREETAAMRSQANTARLLSDNPTLMRLRELEVLENIANSGKLNVVLGEKGLADRVVNLL